MVAGWLFPWESSRCEREKSGVGGEGQPVRIDDRQEKLGQYSPLSHPPFLLPFRLIRFFVFVFSFSFFFPAGKKGLPRHTFALLTNGIQVSLIYNLQSHRVNSPVSAQPAGHSPKQSWGFSGEGPATPLPRRGCFMSGQGFGRGRLSPTMGV